MRTTGATVLSLGLMLACSSTSTNSGSGGGSSTGGASTGGASTGGASTGGASTGGAPAGGASTGGASGSGTGGSSTGGASTGGTAGTGKGGTSGTGGSGGVDACVPLNASQICTKLSKDCGELTADDGCGKSVLVKCGTCYCPGKCEGNVCVDYTGQMQTGAACGCKEQCYNLDLCQASVCCVPNGISCKGGLSNGGCCSGKCGTGNNCVN